MNQAAIQYHRFHGQRNVGFPEFISHKLQQWCDDQQITLQYIQPGEPTQNAFVERNNGALRRELLNARMFTSLREVRMMVAEWQKDYNENRPHKALLYQSPLMYYNNWLNGELKMSASTEALSPSAGVGPKRPQAKTIVDKVLGIPKDDCNNEIFLLNGTTLREPDNSASNTLISCSETPYFSHTLSNNSFS